MTVLLADTPATLVHHHLSVTASATPDHAALVSSDRTGSRAHTYAEIDRDSTHLGAALRRLGLSRGDRVVIVAENSVDLVVTLWAVLRAGGVFVVVNPTTKADKLAFILRDCDAGVIVAQRRSAPAVLSALTDTLFRGPVLWAGGVPDSSAIGATTASHHDIAAALTPGSAPLDDPGLIDTDLAGLIYTSGSTGTPKGVMLTHRNIVHNAWSIASYLELQSDDVIACLLPLSFDYGLFQVFMAARVGATVALERSFAYPHDTLQRLATIGATVLPGVPTIFATLLQLAPFDGIDLGRIRLLTNTAATLPPAHIERLVRAFPGVRLFSMYGLTECTRVSYLPPDRLTDKPGSVGRAMPNTEAYVVDDTGARAPAGVEGELVVRGASVMRGYWHRPEETAACLRPDGNTGETILHTGDRFRADDEGFLYFIGRDDDVFKCKGEKVSPKEVENVLYELEDVVEAAVVGVPHDVDGTAIRALVATRAGSTLTEAALRRHCRQRLESHLVPRFVELCAALPKTQTGKIRRAALAHTGA